MDDIQRRRALTARSRRLVFCTIVYVLLWISSGWLSFFPAPFDDIFGWPAIWMTFGLPVFFAGVVSTELGGLIAWRLVFSAASALTSLAILGACLAWIYWFWLPELGKI